MRVLMFGLILAIPTPAWAEGQRPLTRDECICVAACAFQRKPINPPGAAQCPPIHDELIYDNMARCDCTVPTQSIQKTKQDKPRVSPNH